MKRHPPLRIEREVLPSDEPIDLAAWVADYVTVVLKLDEKAKRQ